MAEEIFDPLKTYNTTLKKSYKENAIKVYEELVAQSKMDVEENRKTVKEYYVLVNNSKKIRSKLNGFRTLRIFLYIFCGLFIVAGILLLVFGIPKAANMGLIIGISIGLFIAGIACLVIGLTVVTKKVRELKKILSSLEAQAEEKRLLAVKQMAPLNALFDWGMPAKIVKLSSPIIELDQYFDIKKFEYLHTKYKVTENTDKDISTVMIFSGSIVGNPFMMVRDLKTAMYDKRWTGSIVIHWTETRRDSKGNTYTVNMSQTLTAYVDRPAPNYFYNTRLIYANDAAPDLHFSRKPTGATGMDENAIRRKVKKGEKTLNKLTSKALSDNDPTTNFTAMANSKFEVIFGALDRDNEVQFRLLYTPVAQLSTVNLLVNGKPYGDDFNYVKDGPLNYIGSDHSANFDYSAEPNRYMTFSVDQSKDLFVNYNCSFIESLYFDLAPLLCIPVYQQHKPFEYIYKDILKVNYTSYEDEEMANNLDSSLFLPLRCITRQILKVLNRTRTGSSDVVTIRSHGYEGINHTEYIPVHGNDGRMHSVPVNWVEYLPVEKDTDMVVRRCEKGRPELDKVISSNPAYSTLVNRLGTNAVYRDGLFAFVSKGNYNLNDDKEFEKLFNNK